MEGVPQCMYNNYEHLISICGDVYIKIANYYVNMHTLLSLESVTYHGQQELGEDGNKQKEECVDG